MTAPVLTYSDYVNLGGQLSFESFNSLVTHAANEVADMVMWKDVPEAAEKPYKAAIASVIDTYSEYGIDSVGGFTIGNFSIQAGSENPRSIARNRARRFLLPTGLLYAGIGC